MIRKLLINIVFFALLFVNCKSKFHPYEHTTVYHDPKASQQHRASDSIISPYKNKLDAGMKKKLVYSAGNFTKDGNENTLGNFICDALRWTMDSVKNKIHSDAIVLVNRGGMRANLNKGDITVNAVYELMPFDNELELVEISGTDLQKITDAILEKKHSFLGLKIEVRNDSKTILDLKGNNIDPQKTYLLLTSDYLVNGGDNFTFGKTKISSEKLNILMRDAIIYYCMHLTYTGKTAIPYTDGRLLISK